MKKYAVIALAILMSSCATPNKNSEVRTPAAENDLSGAYLGEGLFSKRKTGIEKPAMRLYLQRAEGEADTYYGVLFEYAGLRSMAAPFIASDKAPILNKHPRISYLDAIGTRISAYKFVPGSKAGSYQLHNLRVKDGQIVPDASYKMVLSLDSKNTHPNKLSGAVITGNSDGQIVFPKLPAQPEDFGILDTVVSFVAASQYKLAKVIYHVGHLGSTWRPWDAKLEGSYLSEYGRLTDGVLELYSQNGQKKSKFIKTNKTKAKYFTNPKSAAIAGDYVVTEPIPKMYVLVPTPQTNEASNAEMGGRIGLFLDVFDGSAPEAGSKLVTELAFTNPDDPEDFMMYFEHPAHAKNVGVEPKK